MGTAGTDKKDIILECTRQLEDIKTYLELMEGMVKKHNFGSSKQTKKNSGKPCV